MNAARAQRTNLAFNKLAEQSGAFSCPDGSVESASRMVDGLTLPTSNPNDWCPAHRMGATPNAHGIWGRIDLGVSKNIRSIYLAVREMASDNTLKDLGVFIGDTSAGDPRCWLGSPTEVNISQWIECGSPREGLLGRFIVLYKSNGDHLFMYELMAYEDRLVQMYSHKQNLFNLTGG
jgi:hypothetical protein